MMLYEIKFVFYIFCVVYCPGSESLGLDWWFFTFKYCIHMHTLPNWQPCPWLLGIRSTIYLEPHAFTTHQTCLKIVTLSYTLPHYLSRPPPPCLKDCHTVIHLCLETHALRLSHCHTHYLFRSQCYHHISNMPQDVTVRNGWSDTARLYQTTHGVSYLWSCHFVHAKEIW